MGPTFIILNQVGLSVERVLRDYHRDANKSFNM